MDHQHRSENQFKLTDKLWVPVVVAVLGADELATGSR